jgi:hypothetical protein
MVASYSVHLCLKLYFVSFDYFLCRLQFCNKNTLINTRNSPVSYYFTIKIYLQINVEIDIRKPEPKVVGIVPLGGISLLYGTTHILKYQLLKP